MTTLDRVRIGWVDLPAQVQAAVEAILGAPVVAASSQSGGFSPGTADRVRTADGGTAFVKAVSPAQNEHSPDMHRREAWVTERLPAAVPAPRLLGSYDDGDWVALVLSDVEGRQPATPWRTDDLQAVLSTLDAMARLLTPSPLQDLKTARDELAHDFGGWDRIAADPPAGLDPWAAGHLDLLRSLATRAVDALCGDTVVHLDVRADNLLIGADGTVTVVDWPWACLGPAWLDRLLLLINVRMYGGHDTRRLLVDLATTTGSDVDDLIAVLAGLAGFFADNARKPPPPGIPHVRAFQQAQADSTIGWLRES